MITGAQAIIKGLLEQGTDIVFGYPGATICPFYDELAKSEEEGGIRHILVRQEQNAGHMASGYARRSGGVGVCVVTSGPGATNLITGIATAYMDSIPVVAITGQVPTAVLGRDVFQEVDITGACAPFVKHSYLVKDASQIPRIIREAFHLASTGRPGPVLIDVPSDIQNQEFEYKDPGEVNIRGYKPSITGHIKQIKKVAQEINGTKKPLICAGGGVFSSGAQDLIKALSESARIPVVTTMMGIGVMPSADPMNLGMIGQHGNSVANYALNNNDLLIIVGARVGDRAVTNPDQMAEKTRTVHIDIDPAEIGKNLTPTIPLVGDIRHILEKLLAEAPLADSEEWISEVTQRSEKEKYRVSEKRPAGTVGPRSFMKELGKQLDENAYVVADVGQNQIWAGKYIGVKQGRFLTSGGLGTMGYSLPAAIGVKFASPETQTVVVCGDGSFQMMLNELSTTAGNGLDIKVVLFNNRRLGMVNEIQKKAYSKGPYAVYMPETPDFCKVAEAYGIAHRKLDSEDDMADAIKEMLECDGPFLLECRIDPDESTLLQ